MCLFACMHFCMCVFFLLAFVLNPHGLKKSCRAWGIWVMKKLFVSHTDSSGNTEHKSHIHEGKGSLIRGEAALGCMVLLQ